MARNLDPLKCLRDFEQVWMAKMAPRYSPTLALLYDREQKGNANRATLAVARKLVAYLVAVDRGQTHFLVLDQETRTAA